MLPDLPVTEMEQRKNDEVKLPFTEHLLCVGSFDKKCFVYSISPTWRGGAIQSHFVDEEDCPRE